MHELVCFMRSWENVNQVQDHIVTKRNGSEALGSVPVVSSVMA